MDDNSGSQDVEAKQVSRLFSWLCRLLYDQSSLDNFLFHIISPFSQKIHPVLVIGKAYL